MAKKSNTVAGTAADPTVRYASLTLDGRTFKLAYDFNAIATAEAQTGLNLLQKLDLSNLNASQFRCLFFAALLKAQPEITLEEAGDLIALRHLPTITEAILEAWTKSIGGNAEKSDANPPEPEPTPATN